MVDLTAGAIDSETAAEAALQFQYKVEGIEGEIKKRQHPEGHFPQNSPLLERRRIQATMPNGLFKQSTSFDRILIWQLSQDDSETFGDTSIVKPQASQKRAEEEAPRGILVSAGLQALDNLRANGIDLGHVVTFIRHAPWHMRVDNILGHDLYALMLRDGDITGSEDLAKALCSGECRIETRETVHDDGVVVTEHYYVDKEGKAWNPRMPFIGDDY